MGQGGRFETTDKVTIRIIQKIIALILSLFPAINHVIIRILAFFRTCVFLESDFNDFFSGFGRFSVPALTRFNRDKPSPIHYRDVLQMSLSVLRPLLLGAVFFIGFDGTGDGSPPRR